MSQRSSLRKHDDGLGTLPGDVGVTRLGDFYAKVEAATWSEPLWQATVAFFGEAGFPLVSYHHMPPLGSVDEGRIRVVAHGFPEDWVKKYIREKLFRIDPVPEYAFQRETPFLWKDTPLELFPGDEQKRFWKALKGADFGDGLAVQAFGPGGRNGYFGLGFGGAAHALPEGERTMLQSACQAAHLKYCLLLRETLPPPPQLSQRERQILEWVARGKSNSVIAEILGISSHTVDAYLRRVFMKLGTTDRMTAAIRGLGMGVIKGYVS